MSASAQTSGTMTTVEAWWATHKTVLLALAIGVMGILAVLRCPPEVHRLLFDDGPKAAFDLEMRFAEVSGWFSGSPVYGQEGATSNSPYPPASHVILWPLLGWSTFAFARWTWALTLLGSLLWLVTIVVRESGADTLLERVFLVFFIPSMYAACVTIGNGQLGIHVLPLVLAALVLPREGRSPWSTDLVVALLIVVALAKPSFSAPFVWVLACTRRGLRPVVILLLTYASVTLLAVSFRPEGTSGLLGIWLSESRGTALNARYGYANVHQWMSAMGLGEWALVGSVLGLLLLGVWVCRHRDRDVWILMGVAAIVARLWTYHALYDDILILVPMVALFRMTKGSSPGPGRAGGGLLLFGGWLSALAPARLLTAAPPWGLVFTATQTVVWVVMLAFLVANASWLPPRGRLTPLPGQGPTVREP